MAARRSYDILKSARLRREAYVGPWLPEPLLTGPDASEPVLVDESVGAAMLLIMEELSPPERVAFVNGRWRSSSPPTSPVTWQSRVHSVDTVQITDGLIKAYRRVINPDKFFDV